MGDESVDYEMGMKVKLRKNYKELLNFDRRGWCMQIFGPTLFSIDHLPHTLQKHTCYKGIAEYGGKKPSHDIHNLWWMFPNMTLTTFTMYKKDRMSILKKEPKKVDYLLFFKIFFKPWKSYCYSLHIFILLLSFSVRNLWTRFPFHLSSISRVAIGGFIFRYFIFTS